MKIQDVVASFNTTPFLFAGSGITRRYYKLPDWKGLLTHFASRINGSEFAFQSYESKIPADTPVEERLPLTATYIEKDYNSAWFDDKPEVRSGLPGTEEAVRNGVSPFKAEIAAHIKSISVVDDSMIAEVDKLRRISRKNISGVITTNYDCFFESTFEGYKTFVGQDELVFSQLQGIAEIYKIHGSVESPSSIIINQADYRQFKNKGKYLAAKLMTIFMEYPIIFIGYSISDPDIQAIMSDIVECLPADKLPSLQKRFVFIKRDRSVSGAEVSSHSMTINSKVLEMTKISLADFGILYDALSAKKASLPVKVLRRFKDEIYSLALRSDPGPILQVAPLDDKRITDDMLAISIGLSQTGRYGLISAVKSEQWYRNIILHDLYFSADDLLRDVYPELSKTNSSIIPLWYYIDNSKEKNESIIEKAPKRYSDIVKDEAVNRVRTSIRNRSVMQIWNDEKGKQSRALRLLGNMSEESIKIDEYEKILNDLFTENRNILSELNDNDRSSLRRMIRIYDFLKFGKKHLRG